MQAELAAAQAEAARYKACFELSGSGQTMVSLDGILRVVNTRLCEILQRPAHELVGSHFRDITYAADLDEDFTQFNALLAGEIRHFQRDKRYVVAMAAWSGARSRSPS